MSGKTRPMSQIKQLLQLHKQGMKLNTIALSLGISRNTVKSYLQKLSLLKTDIDTLIVLEDPILKVRFHACNPASMDSRFEYFKSRLEHYPLNETIHKTYYPINRTNYSLFYPINVTFKIFIVLLRQNKIQKNNVYKKNQSGIIGVEKFF